MQPSPPFTPPPNSGGPTSGPPTERQRPPANTEERLVADLIALMEAGQAPWRRPWREGSGVHVNLITGRPYRGSNPVLLTLGLHLRGSSLPYWCGWGEARRLDLAPRRGSRGVMILRPLRLEREQAGLSSPDGASAAEAEVTAADGEGGTPARAPRQGIRFRPMVVFNAADLVGDAQASRGLAERIAGCQAQAQVLCRSESERLAAAAGRPSRLQHRRRSARARQPAAQVQVSLRRPRQHSRHRAGLRGPPTPTTAAAATTTLFLAA